MTNSNMKEERHPSLIDGSVNTSNRIVETDVSFRHSENATKLWLDDNREQSEKKCLKDLYTVRL